MKSPVTATASSGRETDIGDIYAEPKLQRVNHTAHHRPNPTSANTKSENPTSKSPISDENLSIGDILPKDQNKCYNIYITGEAGMGKTSLCKNILSSWCKACQGDKPNDDLEMSLNQYDFLFYVSLRNASNQHDIQGMIMSQLLENIASKNEILGRFKPESLLQKLFEQSSRKCLIILDGLDEWTGQGRSKTPVISDGVPGRALNLKYTIMTTTRPWKLEELRLKDSEIDLQIQINGVKSIPTFAKKLISYFNKLLSMKRTYTDFTKCLSKAGLIEMQTIPILLKYLICLWFDSQDFGKSKTEVYTNIIELCFENAEKREGVNDLHQHRHISTDTTIITPGVFKKKCNKYKDILKAVGKLAFETAMDQNGMQLVFNSTDDLTDDQIQICLTVGILTQSIVPSIVCKEKSISFLHKTFHEYFAALYMGWLSSIPEEKFRLTKTNIYEREDIFIFLSGIWPSVSERLLDIFLADTYDKDIMWDPGDIVKKRLQTVVMRCCIESLNQNERCPRVELRVITFTLCDFRSLLSSCNSLLRSRLNIEELTPATMGESSYYRAFFTIISQMSQKNILRTKGENCVLHFSELCGLKHVLLRQLKLDSLRVSPTPLTLELNDITIAKHDGMISLMKSVSSLKTLTRIVMKNIHCTEHKSNKCYLHIPVDLSKLIRLRTINLNLTNMSIDELHVSPDIGVLTLENIEIATHDGIVSLMKRVLSLKTLTQIDMKNIHCTEHKSNKCYLHIPVDLSKLTRLRIINLTNMSINELHVSPDIENLTLENIEIAKHDGIVSLMKRVSSLETLNSIHLKNVHCKEHESNEDCFLNIDLSKHTKLSFIMLCNMSISKLSVSPAKTLLLKDIKIAKHGGINSLMKSVSSLETLNVINFENIHCTEHESNEKCFLNIDLSKLTGLSYIALAKMPISKLHVSPVTESLFLEDIEIAKHKGIVSLIKSLSSLKTLNDTLMMYIHCTKHGSMEKCFRNMDLSQLPRWSYMQFSGTSISNVFSL